MPEIIHYLDNSATTRVCPEAAQKVMEAMTVCYGNPSSRHRMGLAAEELMRTAREQLALVLRCAPEEVMFTSGGTESNNLAILGAARALRRRGSRVVTTRIEHSSAAQAAEQLAREGFEVVRLTPGPDGRVREEELAAAVNGDTVLVSMMLVNNETGAVQPLRAAKEAIRRAEAPALLHCDAVQAFCKVPDDPVKLGADLVSVSAHKIHGPKGAGALYVRKGARLFPLLYGGGQERGLRPGTEAVELFAGFGEAARIAFSGREASIARMAALKELAAAEILKIPGAVCNSPEGSAAHIFNFSLPGLRSEVLLNFLSERGVYVSAGSACSRGRRSPVLEAMGLPAGVIDSALRVSFSRYSTPEDVRALAEGVREAAGTLLRAGVRGESERKGRLA